MIVFYIVGLSTKTSRNTLFIDSTNSIVEKMVVMMRIATKIKEKADLKYVLLLSYHSSFEVLVYKQGDIIVVMAQREALVGCQNWIDVIVVLNE
jgi:hypothetical protein